MFVTHLGEIIALATALCWTITSLSFESAGKKILTMSLNFIRLIIVFILISLYCYFTRGLILPIDASLHNWTWLGLSGLVGFVIGDLFLFQAFIELGARISMLVMASVPPITALMGYIFLDEKLTSFVSSISTAVDVSPTTASIDISGGSINISNESTGLKLNSTDLIDKIKSQIKDMKAPNVVSVTGNVDVVEANIKASALINVNNKISSFSTSYPAGPSGTNLQLAARNIDNIIVMPGETFSTEKAIGPTTIENGFVAANTYVDGQVVPGVGGGVCQVASTLYNTMLRAGIIPSERLNHMMKVSYVPIGLDATLADNLIDLKFVNDFEYPVVVNTYAGNGNLTIEFWSNETVKGGITYEPVSVPLGPLSADAYLYGYDANGELVVNQYLERITYQPLPY